VVDEAEGDGWRIVRVNLDAAISIDHLVPDADWFWTSLQRYCVPDCCGLDAYNFSADSVAWACGWGTTRPAEFDWRADSPGDPEVLAFELRQAGLALRELNAEVATASLFNHYMAPEAFANLFDDLAAKAVPGSQIDSDPASALA